MVSKSFRVILFLILAAWLWGCSAIVPERKTPSGGTKILEEDVTDDRATQPHVGDETPPGGTESVPAVEEAPPGVQPEHRPPRRIKWRDRKGAVKGWESSNEGASGREP